MTRPFTPAQKFRILVNHEAVMLVAGEAVPVSRFHWGTLSNTKRFAIARRLNCAVKCSCGCGVWAPLSEIDFDHVKEHVSGGLTAIKNGAPLRRKPCHAAKSAEMAAVTGKVRRVKRKLTVTLGLRGDPSTSPDDADDRRRRRAWPQRRMSHPTLRRRFDGTVEQRP